MSLSFLKNPVSVTLAGGIILLSGLAIGCSLFSSGVTPGVAKAVDVVQCQLNAVEDVIPNAAVAEDIVLSIRAGNFAYAGGLLKSLDASVEDVERIVEALAACEPASKVPDADADPAELVPSSSVNM